MSVRAIYLLMMGVFTAALLVIFLIWGLNTTTEDVSVHNGCVVSKTERNWDHKVLRVERVCP